MSIKEKFVIVCVFTKQVWIFLCVPCYVLNSYCLKTYVYNKVGHYQLKTTVSTLFLFYVLFMILALISHTRCWLSNPGWTINLPSPISNDSNSKCQICMQYKPYRTHHCKKCNKCVHRLDHHCLWVSNCVGILNHKYFILFIFYTLSACISGLIIGICTFYHILSIGNPRYVTFEILIMLICAFEGIFFVFYAGGYFLDQIKGIRHNQTCIEHFQHKRGVFQNPYKNFEDVFGRDYWFWMIPVKPDINVNYFEEIMVRKMN